MGWRSIVVWYFARTNRLIKKSGISSNSLAVLKTEWYLMAYCKLEGLLGGEEIVESVLEGLLGGEGVVERVLEGLLGGEEIEESVLEGLLGVGVLGEGV
jgi:hypothetical protein